MDCASGGSLRRLTGLALARNLMRDDEGRMQYKRNMESYSDLVLSNPDIRACVWLSATKDEPVIGAAEASDEEGAGDSHAASAEGPATPAIPLPPPL